MARYDDHDHVLGHVKQVGSSNSNGGGSLTPSVLMICIVAASAGLIFGYDIGISGWLLIIFSIDLQYRMQKYEK